VSRRAARTCRSFRLTITLACLDAGRQRERIQDITVSVSRISLCRFLPCGRQYCARGVAKSKRCCAPALGCLAPQSCRSLDIAEKRLPQDGRLSLKIADGRSVSPCPPSLPGHRERGLLLLLYLYKLGSAALGSWCALAWSHISRRSLTSFIPQHTGILLVTGPTARLLKTTTL